MSKLAPQYKRSLRRSLRRKQRRGVLLIVVLSLLVLFALIALTFVVVAGQYGRSARASTLVDITDDQGRDLLDQTIYELLRGPAVNDPYSPAASVLYSLNNDSDFYPPGDPLEGQPRVDEDPIDGVDNDGDGYIDEDPPGGVVSSLLEDRYGGDAVLGKASSTGFPNGHATLFFANATDPENAGLDTRRNAYAGRVLTMLDGAAAGRSTRIMFSGSLPTAPGNPATFIFAVENFDHPNTSVPIPQFGNHFLINGRPFNGLEGAEADESYDAPDRLNPFLAYIAHDGSSVIPSFVDRILRIDDDGDGQVDEGPPDEDPVLLIDNDRDGVLDSGWLNLGFEVKTAADGRRYRPYAAILCLDMDGRLNLNAHGNLGQLSTSNPNYAAPHPGPLAGGGAPPTGQRGGGFGPAEINIRALFGGDETKLAALMLSRYYSANPSDSSPGPGGGVVEDLWKLSGQGIPNDYANSPGEYASPPDVLGGGLLGVDYAGRPALFNAGIFNEFNLSPYQINLVEPNGKDSPFTVYELERLLRYNDVDRDKLPAIWDRHPDLLEADFNPLTTRRSVTTLSSYAPVPLGPANLPAILAERYAAATGAADETAEDNLIARLIPFEILHGGKMNVNRLWGNAVDNSTTPNEVVDEIGSAGELDTASPESIFNNVTAYPTVPTADYLNGVPLKNTVPEPAVDHDQTKGRYLYARQLFTLMMLVMDKEDNADPDDTDPSHTVPASGRIEYRAPVSEAGLSPGQIYDLTVRRIAQWAINCVDYRDADAIMTPFEYDINPFNGWDVDGDLNTVETDPADSSKPHPDRRIVWGCEAPDLLFMESLAMHDRRVRDTAFDNFSDGTDEDAEDDAIPLGSKRIHSMYPTDNDKKGDKDLDQVRIPLGSLFLEFYCPRNVARANPNVSEEVLPRELYVADTLDANKLKLKLDLKVGNSPVWRVAISRPHHNKGNGTDTAPGATIGYNQLSPLSYRTSHPDTATFEPDGMSRTDPTHVLPIERYLWFTSDAGAPGATPLASGEVETNTFYIEDPDPRLLEPGRYCVVGPRDETYIGNKPISDDAAAEAETEKGDQLIDLNSGGIPSISYSNLSGASSYPLSPAAPTNIRPPLALNAVIDSPGYPQKRGLNVSEPLPSATNKYPVPTDDADGDGITDGYGNSASDPATTPGARYPDTPFDSDMTTPPRPLKAGNILDTQTVDNYRTAFLQRLANPLLPWNPYPGQPGYDNGKAVNPYITIDWIPIDLHVFNGEDRAPDDWDTRMGANNTISDDFDTDDDDPSQFSTKLKFAARQRRTPAAPIALNNIWTPGGELGAGLPEDAAADECFRFPLGAPSNPMMTLGYVNQPYTPSPPTNTGDPDAPFPWLTWPNRPFVSQYELMLVPASSQARLLSEFTRAQTAASPYANTNAGGMFHHLMNFYHTSPNVGESGEFYRALEFLEVPSRYVGADRWYAPTINPATQALLNLFKTYNQYQYLAPFHRLSRFRDPGCVNINTINNPATWEAIDNNGVGGPYSFAPWAKVDASRRFRPGDPVADPTLALPQDPFGRFTNAFRGSIAGSDATGVTASSIGRSLLRKDIDVTPLVTNQPPLEGNLPLFGAPATSAAYNDPDNNAYFRMQGLERLGNIVSTQSNVFAVWITIGYFEVDANGLPIRELGQDTGEVTRHRGFYIVDRSIPVGFLRGKNLNVDKTILVRRYIE